MTLPKAKLFQTAERFPDLRMLSPFKTEELKKSISSKNGAAFIVVHPFYPSQYQLMKKHQTPALDSKKYREYLSRLDRFFSQAQKNKLPTIVLEEEAQIEKTDAALAKAYPALKAHFLPTHAHTPMTKITPASQLLEKPPKNRDLFWAEEWDALAEKLDSLGVKKPLVFGTLLEHKTDVNADYRYPALCVGNTYWELLARRQDKGSHPKILWKLCHPEQYPPNIARMVAEINEKRKPKMREK